MQNTLRKVLAPPVEVSLPADKDDQGHLVYKPHQLAYDFAAICLVKTTTGKSMLNAGLWDGIEEDPELFVAIVWAGLNLYQPEITLDEVKAMTFGATWGDILGKILEAWQAARPKADPRTEPTAEPASVQA